MESDRQKWNAIFAGRTDRLSAPEPALLKIVNQLQAGSVLDVACGDGRNGLHLAALGYEVTGVDISDEALDRFEHFCDGMGLDVTTHQLDLDEPRHLLELGPFDNVIVVRFKPLLHFWKVITQVLRPGGTLFFCSRSAPVHTQHIYCADYRLRPGELEDVSTRLRCIELDRFPQGGEYLEHYIFERVTPERTFSLPQMSDQMRPLPDPDHRVFEDIHPPLSPVEARLEADRCLECGGPGRQAPCTRACPTGIDVPRFVAQIREGRPLDASETIYEANVLGGSCARVCPVEVLCEGECVLGEQGRRPIRIGQLQRYATECGLEQPLAPPDESMRLASRLNSARVAVVGAGPSGLSCADSLARQGYDVDVFESRSRPGGLVTYGIAPYKQRVEPIEQEMRRIEAHGVTFFFGTTVGRDLPVKALRQSYDAVFLGVGLGSDRHLDLPGTDLAGVWYSLDLIEEIKLGEPSKLEGAFGYRLAVIGGGNTAIDIAREAIRLGVPEVEVVYRRTEDQMPAYPHEVEAARAEGVKFRWLTSPLRFDGAGRLQAIEFTKMELVDTDGSERPRPRPVAGSEFELQFDSAVLAVGQRTRDDLLESMGIQCEWGRVQVNESARTNDPLFFAGGDCVRGGATVVESVEDGKRAARAIDGALARMSWPEVADSAEVRISIWRGGEDGSSSVDIYAQGDSYVAAEPGMCKGCELCIESCPEGALALDAHGSVEVLSIEDCIFCGMCEARCPDFSIWIHDSTLYDPATGAKDSDTAVANLTRSLR